MILGLGAAGFYAFTAFTAASECKEVSIKLVEYDSVPFLCTLPENGAMMILHNTGSQPISNVDISLVGEKGTSSDALDNLYLQPGDTFPRKMGYSTDVNGEIRQLELTPGIIKGKASYKCPAYKIPIQVKPCT